ncbi:centromere-associated protein E-like [Palaemon carinicauda]|uniref:centromere-associated protein E-like n=1 Tax=Palaemon carinicauda TaxID=392227 RepID=UPI0035B5B91B
MENFNNMCCCYCEIALNTNQENIGYSGTYCVCRNCSIIEGNGVSLIKPKSENPKLGTVIEKVEMCCLGIRKNPIREAKEVALARIVAIHKFERSQNKEEIISRIKQDDEKPQEGIVADLVRKFEKMTKMAKQERSPLQGNEGKVRTLVMQYEERIKCFAKQTRNMKLKQDCLGIRKNPAREAKELALARIVAIHKFERSQNKEEIISRIKQDDDKPQEGIVADLVRKFEKMTKMAKQERSPLQGNEGKVRTLVMQYEERIKCFAKQTRNMKLKQDCLGIRKNPAREAKELALARIVAIHKFERSQNKEEIISRIKQDDQKPQEGIVADLVRKFEKMTEMAKQERSPLQGNEGKVRTLVMQYEERIKCFAKQTRNMKLKQDCLGIRKIPAREAKELALARIVAIYKFERSQNKEEIISRIKQDDEKPQEGIVADLVRKFEKMTKMAKQERSPLQGNEGKVRTLVMQYEERIKCFAKQTRNMKLKQDCLGIRKNPAREAKELALARIVAIHKFERSQNKEEIISRIKQDDDKPQEGIVADLVRKFEKMTKMAKQERSPLQGNEGKVRTLVMQYEERIKCFAKQTRNMKLKQDCLGIRKNPARETKELALARIVAIHKFERSQNKEEIISRIKQDDDKPQEGIVADLVRKFEKMTKMAKQERSPLQGNEGKVRTLVMQYEERIKCFAKQTRNTKLKQDCLAIRKNPVREAKELALARIVEILKFERSQNKEEIIFTIKQDDDKPQEGIVADLVRKSEKMTKMAKQERSPLQGNEGKVRTLVMQYEERIKCFAKQTRNMKLKQDCLGIRKNPAREAKELALARIVAIHKFERSQNKEEIISRIKQDDEKPQEGIVADLVRKFEKITKMAKQERSPLQGNEGKVRTLVMQYEERIKCFAKQTRNMKLKQDCLGIRKNPAREAKELALARIVAIHKFERSQNKEEIISRIKQDDEKPQEGIVADIVRKFEKMTKMAKQERSPLQGNEGKVRTLVMQYEERIKCFAKQTRNMKLKQDCLAIRKNPAREAKELALARIVAIHKFERSQNKEEIISRIKQDDDKPQQGIVADLVRKFEKMTKMAKQERSPLQGNEGKVRTLVMQYEERIKCFAKQTRNTKLKQDCLAIRKNPAREAKELALARIVEILKFERSQNKEEIISRIKQDDEKPQEGIVADLVRKFEKMTKMAKQERSPLQGNEGKVRTLVMQYEERIKCFAKQTRNMKLKPDCLGIRKNPAREAKELALARIVAIHKFERSQNKEEIISRIKQDDEKPQEGIVADLVRKFEKMTKMAKQERSPLQGNEGKVRTLVMQYEERIKCFAKQTRNMKLKQDCLGIRKNPARETKELALARIVAIHKFERSQNKEEIISRIKQDDDKPQEGIVADLVRKFEKMTKMAKQERSPLQGNEGKVRTLVMQYEERIKCFAKQTRNTKLKQDCLAIRKNPVREAKELALARIVEILKFERSQNKEEIIFTIKQDDDKPQEGIVVDLVRKSEKMTKMAKQERSPLQGNEGKVRTLVMQYEERIKCFAKQTRNMKLKQDCLGIRKNPAREAKELALARIVAIHKFERSQNKEEIISRIKQDDEKPQEGIVADIVRKFEKMTKMAKQERSPLQGNEGKVRTLVMQYEERIKCFAKQTRNMKLKQDCLGIRKNPAREAKELALARIVAIHKFERSQNKEEIISRIKQDDDKPQEGIVADLVRKFEKMTKMAKQERSPLQGNEGKVRTLVMQYEERIKCFAKQTRNTKLKQDCLAIRKNPIREAKELALARIVEILKFERSQNKEEIISRIKQDDEKPQEGIVADLVRKFEKMTKMAKQERSPLQGNEGKVRTLVMQYEERIKCFAKQTRNMKLKPDCLGIRKNPAREAKELALARIVAIHKFERSQNKEEIISRIKQDDEKPQEGIVADLVRKFEKMTKMAKQERSPLQGNEGKVRTLVMQYEERIKCFAKQTRNMKLKPDCLGIRKNPAREAKELALARIVAIHKFERSQNKEEIISRIKQDDDKPQEGIVADLVRKFEKMTKMAKQERSPLQGNEGKVRTLVMQYEERIKCFAKQTRNMKLKQDCLGIRKNPAREAKELALARIVAIYKFERSQNKEEIISRIKQDDDKPQEGIVADLVRKFEKMTKMAKQERSPLQGNEGKVRTLVMQYEERIKCFAKQTRNMKLKQDCLGIRKNPAREAKELALARIVAIHKFERSQNKEEIISRIKQDDDKPQEGIVADLVRKFEKMTKMAKQERSPLQGNEGKVRTLVMQYEERIKCFAKQTRNMELKQDCLGIRKNPAREAKELALARIVAIHKFERSQNKEEIISRIKQDDDKPQEGIVADLVRKFEKMTKMAKQERSPLQGNEGKVRTLVMQYEERIKCFAQQTRNTKLKQDCLAIRKNPAREAKELALARIVEILKFERSQNKEEIISRIKQDDDKPQEGIVADLVRKFEKMTKMAKQERSPLQGNEGKVRTLVMQYEERIKCFAKQTRNMKLKPDCLGIRKNPAREAKELALARIVAIHKFERSQNKEEIISRIKQDDDKPQEGIVADLVRKFEKMTKMAKQERSPLQGNEGKVRTLVMQYEERIKCFAKQTRNMKLKPDCLGIRKNPAREAKELALARIVAIHKFERSQNKEEIISRIKQNDEKPQEGIVADLVRKFEKMTKMAKQERSPLQGNEGKVRTLVMQYEERIKCFAKQTRNMKLKQDCLAIRKNPAREAKELALARIVAIHKFERSQNKEEIISRIKQDDEKPLEGIVADLVRKFEKMTKMAKQERSPLQGNEGKVRTLVMQYEERIKCFAKQTRNMKLKPDCLGIRKNPAREAKELALARIVAIHKFERSQNKEEIISRIKQDDEKPQEGIVADLVRKFEKMTKMAKQERSPLQGNEGKVRTLVMQYEERIKCFAKQTRNMKLKQDCLGIRKNPAREAKELALARIVAIHKFERSQNKEEIISRIKQDDEKPQEGIVADLVRKFEKMTKMAKQERSPLQGNEGKVRTLVMQYEERIKCFAKQTRNMKLKQDCLGIRKNPAREAKELALARIVAIHKFERSQNKEEIISRIKQDDEKPQEGIVADLVRKFEKMTKMAKQERSPLQGNEGKVRTLVMQYEERIKCFAKQTRNMKLKQDCLGIRKNPAREAKELALARIVAIHKFERSQNKEEIISRIKQDDDKPQEGIVADLVRKFEKMTKMAKQERSPLQGNEGKVRTLVMQYEERIKCFAQQTRNMKLKQDCLAIRKNPAREAKELALARIVAIHKFERSQNKEEIISRIKQDDEKPQEGIVADLVRKFEKMTKMAKQERSPLQGNEGKVRTLVMQYEERIKCFAKQTKNTKLKQDCLAIRKNPVREAKELALARIVAIHKFERSQNKEEIISRIKQDDEKPQEGIVADLVRKFEKMTKMAKQERSPLQGNEGKVRTLVMQYEERIKCFAKQTINMKLKPDCLGIRKNQAREAKELALARIVAIHKFERSQNKEEIISRIKQDDEKPQEGIVADLVRKFEKNDKNGKTRKKSITGKRRKSEDSCYAV